MFHRQGGEDAKTIHGENVSSLRCRFAEQRLLGVRNEPRNADDWHSAHSSPVQAARKQGHLPVWPSFPFLIRGRSGPCAPAFHSRAELQAQYFRLVCVEPPTSHDPQDQGNAQLGWGQGAYPGRCSPPPGTRAAAIEADPCGPALLAAHVSDFGDLQRRPRTYQKAITPYTRGWNSAVPADTPLPHVLANARDSHRTLAGLGVHTPVAGSKSSWGGSDPKISHLFYNSFWPLRKSL